MNKIEELKKKLAEIGWETEEPSKLLKVDHPVATPRRRHKRRAYKPRTASALVAIDYINEHMGEDYTYEQAAKAIGIPENTFGFVARRLMQDGKIPYRFNIIKRTIEKEPEDLTEKVNKLIQKASDSVKDISLEAPKTTSIADEVDRLAWEFIKAEECTDLMHFVKWTKENYGR